MLSGLLPAIVSAEAEYLYVHVRASERLFQRRFDQLFGDSSHLLDFSGSQM